MRREMIVLSLFILFLSGICVVNSVQHASAAEKKKLLRVGIYDSRGIAIAYAHSHFNEDWYQKMKSQLDAAQAAGDEQKVKELKEIGNKEQAKKHLQAFGTTPVHEYLDLIKDQIPSVAQKAWVDLIVSKWETDYLSADAEVVDVTMELAKLFNPSVKAYKSIESLGKWKPYSHEDLEQLEKEHSY